MRFPDPRLLRPQFERRGFVVVRNLLDRSERSAFSAEAIALARRYSAAIDRANSGQRLCYTVVTGDRIKASGRLLFSLYTAPEMLSWVRSTCSAPSLALSSHLRSAININCLHTAGQQYPWHRDAVPYTCLLFLSSLPTAAGGAFLIRAGDGELVTIQPRAGVLLLLDGARCPHAVAPLAGNALRLTVPMVYPAESTSRPAGLDEYLYGPADASM
jgi:hypothetical protein